MADTIPLDFQRRPPAEVEQRARAFAAELTRRRTVRDFSADPVSRDVIAACLRAAETSGPASDVQHQRSNVFNTVSRNGDSGATGAITWST